MDILTAMHIKAKVTFQNMDMEDSQRLTNTSYRSVGKKKSGQ